VAEEIRFPADWRQQLHKVENGAMDSRATAKTVALIESWIASSPLPETETETEHVIEFREDGWTIKHPLACRPNLFDCAVNRAAGRALQEPPAEFGRFACGLAEDGQFVVGDRREATS
jgi:hypothetical protein